MLAFAVVLSMVHLEADVPVDGGDFVDVPFVVPAGTQEIRISHTDGDDFVILDFGVWSPDGFRGWGGGNTEDAIIGIEQSSRSYLPGPIPEGMWTVVIGKAKLDPGSGGHYSIDVICDDTPTLVTKPQAPYTPVVLGSERRWYKGDFHVHSDESGDASATFDQIATLAADRGLDFVNISDHNTSSHLGLMAAQQPGFSVLLLRGAEITTYAGHGNAVGLPSYVDHRVGYQGRTIDNILDDVAAQGALFIINHPSLDLGEACIGCAWEHDPTPYDKVAAIEIITGKWDVVERLFVPRAIEMWDEQLAAGHRIAAVGGSDDHRAGTGTGLTDTPIGSPTTLVLADELSEAGLIDGIRKGRTMVMLRGPDDPFVDVRVRTAGGELAEIGDDIDGVATVTMPLTITNGMGNFVQLWRDGVELEQVEITSDPFEHTFVDTPGASNRRYRVEVINNANNRIVVTSHFFVTAIAEQDGCGCRSSSPASMFGPLLVLGLLVRRRRLHARSQLV